METTLTKTTPKTVKHYIPDELVYEKMNGKPIYYKGYEKVINYKKEIQDIMGSSNLQTELIDVLLMFLYQNINLKTFTVKTNEVGLHLGEKNNLAADITIFEKEKLYKQKIEDKYISIPPKVIIEIDTKADLNDFDNVMDYYTQKTNKLFDFGVEKVFWILTSNKQIISAKPNESWKIIKWENKITIFDNLKFSLKQLLIDKGIYDLID